MQQALDIEAQRRRYVLAFCSYITSAVMFIYGLKNLNAEHILLPIILFGTSLAFLLNMLGFYLSKNLQRACIIEAFLVSSFVLSLVYQGGYNNTALYWVYPFPAILFGLLGNKKALLSNMLLLLVLSCMLLIPDLTLAHYKDAEVSRFLASLLIVITVCWIDDHFRARSHNAMDLLHQNKEYQANTDALTGLVNRRFIDAILNEKLLSQPNTYFPLAVVMCDIDHFKQLNDQFGHAVGDEVLRDVAKLFQQNLRQQDIASRTGGEEFLLIFPQTEYYNAYLVAEKIRVAFEQYSFLKPHPNYRVTASFGVAQCHNASDFSQAVLLADQQLYLSKENGRNQVN